MNSRQRRFANSVVFLAAACRTAPPAPTADDILERLRESVPVGTHRADLVKFCREQGLALSCCDQSGLPTTCVPPKEPNLGGRCYALVGGGDTGSLARKDYAVEADFAADDRISDLRVSPVYTAP